MYTVLLIHILMQKGVRPTFICTNSIATETYFPSVSSEVNVQKF